MSEPTPPKSTPPTWDEKTDRPVFRFTSHVVAPHRHVLCLNCGWEAWGNRAAAFARADDHVCERHDD